MYLTHDAINATLAEIGGLAPGTELIADYMLPAGLRDADADSYVDQVAAASAERGEPWRTFLSPGDMDALLAGHGIDRAEHIRQRDAVDPDIWNRTDSLRPIDMSMLVRGVVRSTRARPALDPR